MPDVDFARRIIPEYAMIALYCAIAMARCLSVSVSLCLSACRSRSSIATVIRIELVLAWRLSST